MILVALLAALADRAAREPARPGQLTRWHEWFREERLIGIGCAVVVLAGAFSFVARPAVVGLAVTAIAAVVLLPRAKVDVAARAAQLTPTQRTAAVRRVVRLAGAQRTWAAVHKGLRAKVAADELSLDAANAKLREAERQAGIGVPGSRRAESVDRAFAHFGGDDAWQRAKWGTAWGLLVGLPWMAVSTFAAIKELPRSDPYPVLASVAALAPVLLQWPAYGLFFGYFFPLLRGRTGIGKATIMMSLAFAVTAAGTIAAGARGSGWPAIALAAVQMLVFAVVLGLRADGDVLERHGRRRAELADLHNLGPATAVGSAIAIAVVTAVLTTVLAGSLQPFLAELAPPAPAATTPPATPGVPR